MNQESINPQKLTKEQIRQKWGALVTSVCKLTTDEDIQKVSKFAHYYALNELIISHPSNMNSQLSALGIDSMEYLPTHKKSLLEMNLRVITNIFDLSNIKFVMAPNSEEVETIKTEEDGVIVLKRKTKFISVGTTKTKIKVEKDLLHSLQMHATILNDIEDAIVEAVSKQFNTVLSLNKKLYIYKPIERIIKTENTVTVNTKNDEESYVEFEIYSRWYKEDPSLTLSDTNETLEEHINIK